MRTVESVFADLVSCIRYIIW